MISPSCIWRNYWMKGWGRVRSPIQSHVWAHTLRSAHWWPHQPGLLSMPSPHSPNSDAGSQQCPTFPSSLLDSSQTPSFVYFSLKAHGRYYLARTMFPASYEHPASQPLERCTSDGLVWFIQVFPTECFNCRLTYRGSYLKYPKVPSLWCFGFAGQAQPLVELWPHNKYDNLQQKWWLGFSGYQNGFIPTGHL